RAHPQDHGRQCDKSRSPGREKPHRVLPAARAPFARTGYVQGDHAEGEGNRMSKLLAFIGALAIAASAWAQELTPDQLVQKITEEVLAAVKSDKELAAGDK